MKQNLKESIIFKNQITQKIRFFFTNLGYQETNTTNLRLSTDDKGFKVTDTGGYFPESYLRRSHGVALRTLLSQFNMLFEIGTCYRLDAPSQRHNPEFQMVEAYTYGQSIDYYKKTLLNLLDFLGFRQKHPPIAISIRETLKKEADIDIATLADEEVYPILKKKFSNLLKKGDSDSLGKLIDRFAEKLIESQKEAVFVSDYHKSTTPFAKQIEGTNLIHRFEFSVEGLEIADCIIFEDNGDLLKEKCIKENVFGQEQALLHQLIDMDSIPKQIGGIGFSVERLLILLSGRPIKEFIFNSQFTPYHKLIPDQ